MELESEFLNNLSKYCELGFIRKSQHPELPITIYNYTQKASFEEKWDNITINSRGLILNNDGKIIIKGPKKFFNKEEKWSAKFDISQSIISEKLDGYYISIKLDSLYGLVISSRGSFCNNILLRPKNSSQSQLDGKYSQIFSTSVNFSKIFLEMKELLLLDIQNQD